MTITKHGNRAVVDLAVDLFKELQRLSRERDSARDWAVALEQENAELSRHVAVQAAGQERYRDEMRARIGHLEDLLAQQADARWREGGAA